MNRNKAIMLGEETKQFSMHAKIKEASAALKNKDLTGKYWEITRSCEPLSLACLTSCLRGSV